MYVVVVYVFHHFLNNRLNALKRLILKHIFMNIYLIRIIY
jgi:hypothetical protein